MVRVAPWQSIFWFAAALAVIGAIWCVRFGETLAEENRRPLQLRQIWTGVKVVARTRVTAGHMAANVFLTGAFFIFLGSSQPVFDQVFDRSSQFAVFFALIGALTVPALIVNNRLIGRHGARRMSLLTCAASAVLSAAAIVPSLVSEGRPSFWLWYVWLVFVTSSLTLATPSITALALEPMGELAGTASSLLFFSGFAFGGALAAIFDARVEDSVTPFVLGYALYTAIGFSLLLWAGAGSSSRSVGAVPARSTQGDC